MGFYKNDATAANNTALNGIDAQGGANPRNIDDLIRELAAQGKQFALDIGGATTVGGTADAITISANDSVADAYFDGMVIGFVAGSDNATTTPTANVNSIGAEPIKKAISTSGAETALVAGDIQSGGLYLLRWRSAWDSGNGAWQLVDFQYANAASGHNYLYNPEFAVVRHGTASFTAATAITNDDGNYTFARWILLSDGNDVVDIDGNSTAGRSSSAQAVADFTVVTAAKKFGFLQILPWTDARDLLNEVVSLSFMARSVSGAAIGAVRAAILISDTTSKDAVTKDVVSSWNAAGTNPTLISSWSYANTPTDIAISATGTDPAGASATWDDALKKLENVTITAEPEGGDSGNNIAVFVWVDEATSVGDRLQLTKMKLEKGARATAFHSRSFTDEQHRCGAFSQVYTYGVQGGASTSARINIAIGFTQKMRDQPTPSLLDTSIIFNGAAGNVTSTSSTIVSSNRDSRGMRATIDGFTGLTTGQIYASNQSTEWLFLDAEIGT